MALTQQKINQILIEDFEYILEQKRFFHYSSFETALNHIIIGKSLQFSDPTTFNDPFDCNEKILFVNYERELIDNILKSKLYNRAQRRSLKTKELKKNQNQIMREKRREFKIFCFSSKNDNVLMWSHYADKHNGICCGFDFPISYPNKFIMTPVKYIDRIMNLSGETELYKIILYWLTTKSKVWKYEDEFRAIMNAKSTQQNYEYINFDDDYLKEIIFGCNVKQSQIDIAIKKLKASNISLKNVEMKRAELNHENYKLKIVDI